MLICYLSFYWLKAPVEHWFAQFLSNFIKVLPARRQEPARQEEVYPVVHKYGVSFHTSSLKFPLNAPDMLQDIDKLC